MNIRFYLSIICLLLSVSAHATEAKPALINDAYSFSFAIKGGISLGSYESGMNWFFIEKLRRYSQQQRQIDADFHALKVISGASAGGINAIISALRFCQKDDVAASPWQQSLFFQAWNVDANQLLPELSVSTQVADDTLIQSLGVHDEDGILHRSALEPSLQLIAHAVKQKNFRAGCVTHLALPITVLRDGKSKQTADETPITLRYAVPLRLSVDESQQPHFSNLAVGDAAFRKIDDFMYLEAAKGTAEGDIPFHNILRLALASSALPLAFSPVEMMTCLPDTEGQCGQDRWAKRTFIDGSSLDNSPVGLTTRIAEYIASTDSYTWSEKNYIVYLNPAHRSTALQNWQDRYAETSGLDSIRPVGLQDYQMFLAKFLDYGMNAEYSRSVRMHGKPPTPPRHYMLTADHLLHFAAFAHESFRQFDFMVGVYDAYATYMQACQMGLGLRQCHALPMTKDQPGGVLFHDLDRLASGEVLQNFCLDPSIHFSQQQPQCGQSDRLSAIACALCLASASPQPESLLEQFDHFRDQLPDDLRLELEQKLGRFGSYRLLNIITEKQLAIERRREAKMKTDSRQLAGQKKITWAVAVSNWFGRTMQAREGYGYWPRTTADPGRWQQWLPDEVGIDGLNSVPYVRYNADLLLWKNTSLAFAVDPFHLGRDNRNTSSYSGVTLGVRRHMKDPAITSLAVGVNSYYNWKPSMAHGRLWDHGVYMDIGLAADKVHILLVQRETAGGLRNSRFTFLVSLRDIGGMLR